CCFHLGAKGKSSRRDTAPAWDYRSSLASPDHASLPQDCIEAHASRPSSRIQGSRPNGRAIPLLSMPASLTAPERWIVLKFGGTSVSRRHRWHTIGRLAKRRAEEHSVEGQDARVLVVVSALSGVTNELTAIADGAADSAERIDRLEQRHREFVAELE